MSFLLSRLSLKRQISAIIALAGIVFALVGGVSVLSSLRQDRHDRDFLGYVELERITSVLAFDLLDARRREKDFLARRSDVEVDKHAAALADARLQLDKLARLHEGPQIAKIGDHLTAYADIFAKVVAAQRLIGYSEKDGALGDLRNSVHAVEQLLKDHDAPRLAVLMLMMRRHEKDFLARRDPKYQDDMSKRAAEFAALLAQSAMPAAVQDDITAKMRAYHQDFAAVVTATMALGAHTDGLARIYAAIEPDIDSLRLVSRVEATKAQTAREDVARFGQRASLSAILIGGALIAVLGSAIARGIYLPLQRMTAAMEQLAAGSMQIEIPSGQRRDEVGAMAKALQVFKDNAAAAQSLRHRQEQMRTEGEQAKLAALTTMAETVERESRLAVDRVAERTRSMAGNAEAMAHSADLVGSNAQGVAAAADQALANAQTVAAASEQLSASIAEIAQQVSSATQVTHDAVQSASQAQETIARLSDAVGRIDEITVLISEIASQTNLLALNATIEAARAGEAGKGFAVVAGEVKSLASQTARATGEISTQIAAIQSTTRHAVEAVGQIASNIDAVESIASAIAAAIEEQGAATGEIARNVAQTSDAATEVSARIADVSDEAQSTGQQAAQVSAISAEVADAIQNLRDTLIRVVRTSTREVDRRQDQRFSLNRAARLIIDGQALDGQTVDCGKNGATLAIDGGLELNGGSQAMVSIDGIGKDIAVEIVAAAGGQAHLHFLRPLPEAVLASIAA
ncbi:methyl-accepting chemotaxis protein [Magnetospirillum sulfuroxidans]|uniref:HAMP domain-containing protein n=1 Tax=Magnetospirillum sulfuroxidans TaxID=611300 RepID=A0ABS5I8M7_9PROT|nr:HAMP domain-containing methyl-accepting chemotaxis protein [Magnetospirillum sulfuroxidans]MBR9970669.1 HAMP domain-containing protein [Magnetospirillum sulfuroxidans]